MAPSRVREPSRARAGAIGLIVAVALLVVAVLVASLVVGRPAATPTPAGATPSIVAGSSPPATTPPLASPTAVPSSGAPPASASPTSGPGSPSTAPSSSPSSGPSVSPSPASPTPSPTTVASPVALVPWDELDRRWGTYVSEREWGTPREAVGGNGWGLGYTNATGTPYRYSEDGIAGISDEDGDVIVSWALWDGQRSRVTERYFGSSNPQGEHGETILDDRVFLEHSPTHSYARQRFRYGAGTERVVSIDLEMAKVDSRTILLRATATGETGPSGPMHLVVRVTSLRAYPMAPIDRGFSVADDYVVVIGERPFDGWLLGDKGDLDASLRAGGLPDAGQGRYGALDTLVQAGPGTSGAVTVAVLESLPTAGPDDDPVGAATAALATADRVFAQRRAEAEAIFAGRVSDHEDLYRAALSALLWNESRYSWDGQSSALPRWTGRVEARDVLIMPDKWEYPYVAAWDSAFQAVTATLIDNDLAQAQLRFLLSDRWQQPNGHVPCAEWVMELECPPILAWSAWRVAQAGAGRRFLQQLYPALQRQFEWWRSSLGVEPGLYAGGFLGMDNLPRPRSNAQADGSAWMAMFAGDLARIARELGRIDDAVEYDAERATIARVVNERLWNEATGLYHDLDDAGTGFIAVPSYSGLVPLIAGIVPPDRTARILGALRDEGAFLSPAGIRSVPANSGAYTPGYAARGVNSNWLGPVWLPINYLLIQRLEVVDPALAEEIRRRVISAVEADWKATGRFHEYFHGDTGEGLGADEQGWTLLVANLIRASAVTSP